MFMCSTSLYGNRFTGCSYRGAANNNNNNIIIIIIIIISGPGSLIGIATGYGLDGPGIESR
jgi:hypothetical protein